VVVSKHERNTGGSKGNCIGGIMVSVLTSSAVDHVFEPRSGQIKDFKIWYLLILR
jgi:hypothetical protein